MKKELVTDVLDMLDELISNHGKNMQAAVESGGSVRMSFSRDEHGVKFSLMFGVKQCPDEEDDE